MPRAKAPPVKIHKDATAAQIVEALDGWFKDKPLGEYAEANMLWLALSALRGPDDQDDQAKANYTWPIRYALFPSIALQMSCPNGPEKLVAEKTLWDWRNSWEMGSMIRGSHYLRHIALASKALIHMKRYTPNEPES